MFTRLFSSTIAAGLFLMPATGEAQIDMAGILMEGMKDAVVGMAPVPEAERKMVLEKVAEALAKRMTFRDDGVASSVHEISGRRTYVEWKQLKVSGLRKQSLSAADEANGVTRRYQISFGCAASRVWEKENGRWSDWRPTGYAHFPSGWTVEERNGVMTLRLNEHGRFLPGPGRSFGGGEGKNAPAGGARGLPPGMRRAGSAE